MADSCMDLSQSGLNLMIYCNKYTFGRLLIVHLLFPPVFPEFSIMKIFSILRDEKSKKREVFVEQSMLQKA